MDSVHLDYIISCLVIFNTLVMLRVFYGWTKTNKIRKAEAISVIYENRPQREEKVQSFINRVQHTVYVREQTVNEQKDGEMQNRIYTEYSIRLDDKNIKGNLEKALNVNFNADCNNVPEAEREIIRTELRKHYKLYHLE